MNIIPLNQLMGLFTPLINFFKGLWALIGRMFYYLIICGIGRIADICQLIFRKFAGISETGVNVQDGANILNSNTNGGGDVALTFLNSNIVKNLFFACLVLAIVILLITTFAAVIKTEFAKDGNNNKRKVIKNAFRGLANFVLVPLICIFGLIVGNAILRALDGATSNG